MIWILLHLDIFAIIHLTPDCFVNFTAISTFLWLEVNMFLFLSLWHAPETINSLSLSCLVVWLAVGCPSTHTLACLVYQSMVSRDFLARCLKRKHTYVSSYDSGPLTWDIDAHELSFLLFGSNQTYLFRSPFSPYMVSNCFYSCRKFCSFFSIVYVLFYHPTAVHFMFKNNIIFYSLIYSSVFNRVFC